MNKKELIDRLKQLGIDPHGGFAFSDIIRVQGVVGEHYKLEQHSSNLWGIYYSERGVLSKPQLFSSEEQACDAFWKVLQWEVEARA